MCHYNLRKLLLYLNCSKTHAHLKRDLVEKRLILSIYFNKNSF